MHNELMLTKNGGVASSWTEYYLKQRRAKEDIFDQKTSSPIFPPNNLNEKGEAPLRISDLKGKVCDELVESLFTEDEIQKWIKTIHSSGNHELDNLLKKLTELRDLRIYK